MLTQLVAKPHSEKHYDYALEIFIDHFTHSDSFSCVDKYEYVYTGKTLSLYKGAKCSTKAKEGAFKV